MNHAVSRPGWDATFSREQTLEWGALRLHLASKKLYVEGEVVLLRRKEYDFLHVMLSTPEKCFSRDELLLRIWGLDFDTGTNLIEVLVYNLRKKIREVYDDPVIETLRGVGYRLVDGI